MLAEADPLPLEFLLDEAVTVQVIGDLEGEERGHPQDHRPERLVADIEVVVCEAAALTGEDAVMRVLARILRQADAVGRPLLHALEDEVDAIGVASRHPMEPRQDVVLLAHPLLGPLDRDRMIARIGFHPALVIVRPLAQHLLADLGDTDDVAEEVHDQLRPRQRCQIAVNDNAIEAVIDEDQELAEQPGEDVHRLAPATVDQQIGQSYAQPPSVSTRRRDSLHPATGSRSRRTRPACPLLDRNRRCLAPRPLRPRRRTPRPRRRSGIHRL